MRVLRFTALDTLNDPPELHAPTLVDKQYVWNALISTLKPNLIYKSKTKHLTRSRTLEIIDLCATATARRLYGN